MVWSVAPKRRVHASTTDAQDADPVGPDSQSGPRRVTFAAAPRSFEADDDQDERDLELTGRELIALPSPQDPFATLFRDSYGVWVLEQPGRPVRYPQNHDVCDIGGQSWRLRCGLASDGKRFTQRRPPMSLAFVTSADGECEEISIISGSRRVTMRAGSEDYLLLLLARRRVVGPSGVPDADHGFVGDDECARALGVSSRRLEVDIYRVRERVASLGIPRPADVIERRPEIRELRIGTPHVTIHVRGAGTAVGR